MRIKTITCHDVYNYGAALQAYALQQYLLSKGHEVEIIDYKPDYLSLQYKFWNVPKSSHYYDRAMKSNLFRFLLCCYFAPKRYATFGRKRKFDNFKKNNLRCTKRYENYQQLVNCPPQADAYIAGSDQIWNCALPNGKDPSFFLQFGSEKVCRISYAASFSIPEIIDEYIKQIKEWLNSFYAISVRERTGVDILNKLGVDGIEVVDPVFLLSRDDWSVFSGPKKMVDKKYILVYDLYLNDNRLRTEAERLSAEHELAIVSVDAYFKCPYAHKNISSAGPKEFVNLIENADYVITNSFHATAFSVIFNKPFSVYYKYSNISRMADFLQNLEMSYCLNAINPQYNYNWEMINNRLRDMCEHSFCFLSKNLCR